MIIKVEKCIWQSCSSSQDGSNVTQQLCAKTIQLSKQLSKRKMNKDDDKDDDKKNGFENRA
jgi:hypothetical protein